MTATSPDQIGQLVNNVETLDLVNSRAAMDYDLTVGAFMQHRHEVLNREKADAKPIGIESVGGVTFATTPSGLFSWGTQNSPEWLLKRNAVSIRVAALESASVTESAQDEQFNGKSMKHAHARTPEGEDVGLYFDPETKLLAGFEILDTETMLGDVTSQYTFSDYKDVGGIKLPHHVKIRKGNEDYSEIQFASIAVNDPRAADVFALPKDLDAKAWDKASVPDSFPMTLTKASNGVYHALGFRHHSMVVEFPTFVAVVEAPYLETQTHMLAKAIAIQFPNKPIRYVAVTHFHYDHIGGVRAAAALGGKANLKVDTMVGGHGLTGPFSELTTAIAAMK